MPSFQINDDEREALRGLPMLAREIYVFGLRPFMDFSTGIVGIKRGVSWKSIAEELYVEPHQGIKGGEASEKELRRALVWLQKAGLLGQNQAERRLVFELLLATRDQSVRKKVGSKWADEVGSHLGGSQPSNDEASTEEEGREVGGVESPKVGTPPLSGIPPTSLSAREAPVPGSRFPMHDDWMPTSRGWKSTAMRNGLGAIPINSDVLREFRSYWINREDRHQSQGQWEHDLAQSHIRSIRYAQTDGRNSQAGRRGARPRSLSAVDQVEQAIAEQRAALGQACGADFADPDGEALANHDPDLRAPLDGEFWRETVS